MALVTGQFTPARTGGYVFALIFGLVLMAPQALAQSGVTFSHSFSPDTIGPGSISTLVFRIESTSASPVTDLAFANVLPAGVTIASPAGGGTDCGAVALVTAPEGGATIVLSDGSLPGVSEGSVSCELAVNVTGATPGTHMNDTGDLTSSLGNHGPSTADLTVDTERPSFTKVFSPDEIVVGHTSTLTFTIDNSASGSQATNLAFTDPLPEGLQVANPPNAATDCVDFVGPSNFDPVAGATSVGYAGGVLDAGDSCTLVVDVVGSVAGTHDNLTGDLTFSFSSSGKAGDVLTVRVDPLIKRFTDDPVPPGDTATLEFTITNLDRNDSLTDIQFTDDLDAALSGLQAVPPLPSDVCGAGSTISGTSLLTFSGGSLAPGDACTFSVTVQVPASVPPGAYPNTTSVMTGELGFETVTLNPASDELDVDFIPLLTKTFLEPVTGAGESVDVEFTIINTSPTSEATGIEFTDNLTEFLPGATAVGLPADGFCGTGSTINPFSPNLLAVSGASLAPGGSCTFAVTIDVPAGTPSNIYTNTTSAITASIDGVTRMGPAASDELEVLGAPLLTKAFTDDPVRAGDTVTLEFTIAHDELAPSDATDIAFTDDLDAALSGLTAIGLPLTDVCGAGSQLDGTTTLALTGGTLAPGESCTFAATLQVPAGAPLGFHTNTTAPVSATIAGEAAVGLEASDDLLVSGLELTKSFVDDPVLPGDTVTLRFTLENVTADLAATDIAFTDDLDAVLTGLTAVGLPTADVCGAGSQITGTANLVLTGGSLPAGASCTFDVTVQVPAGAATGTYFNATSVVSATMDGTAVELPGATDTLDVNRDLIGLGKVFTDDPAAPGGTVTLEFTVTNLSTTEALADISFTDDLDAALSGLVSESGVQPDVCGAGSQLSGTGLLTLTGGSLAAGAGCTFSVTLRLPTTIADGAEVTNTTSAPTGTASGLAVSGPPASDVLAIGLLDFSKAFDGPSAATGTVGLVFTIENLSTTEAVGNIRFSDNLEAVIPGLAATNTPLTDVCGAGSSVSGSSTIAFSEGSLSPGQSCTFQVDLAVPADATPGSYVNISSNLTSGGLPIPVSATDNLAIEPPPAFAKLFAPNAITVGGISTLTFQIDNTASILAAGSLAFDDNLPAGLVVAPVPNAASSCGGTVTAVVGSGTIALSGGNVAAGSACSVSVDISATAEGNFINTSGSLLSSNGDSGTASDAIQVVSGDFVFNKAFRTSPVLPGGLVEMELTVVNGSAFPLTDIAASDDLAAAVPGTVAEGLPLADVCGAGSQLSGTSVVSLSGGNLAPGASCTVVVPVRVPADAPVGTFTNTTSTATAVREGLAVEAPSASADLIVAETDFGKSLNPAVATAGSTVTLSFALGNPDPANSIGNVGFSDDLEAFVSGMTAMGTPIDGVCGAGSVLDGTSTLSLTGGTLPAGGSCNFQVTLSVPAEASAGQYTNTTGAVSGEVDGHPVSIAAASAELEIEVEDDLDGVPPEVEDQAPNGGDGNGDGTPDRRQSDVASLPAFDGSSFLTLVLTGGCDRFNNVVAVDPASQPPAPGEVSFPFGLVAFEVPCETATIDIVVHDAGGAVGDSYWKYGPTTPGDAGTAAWYELSGQAAGAPTGATVSGNTWSLMLADNELGDDTGDDGVIVDQGGPAATAPATGPVVPVPAVDSRWTLMLLGALLLMAGLVRRRGRP